MWLVCLLEKREWPIRFRMGRRFADIKELIYSHLPEQII